MERSVALKKLMKRFGKKLRYRYDPKAPSKEEREAARAEMKPLIATRDDLGKQMQARTQALIQADDQYQALKEEYRDARERIEKLSAISSRYRVEVLTDEGFFHHVQAQGDSWEDVFAQLKKKT